MQSNTAIVNTVESNTAILQIPEETASLIKASIAEIRSRRTNAHSRA